MVGSFSVIISGEINMVPSKGGFAFDKKEKIISSRIGLKKMIMFLLFKNDMFKTSSEYNYHQMIPE